MSYLTNFLKVYIEIVPPSYIASGSTPDSSISSESSLLEEVDEKSESYAELSKY